MTGRSPEGLPPWPYGPQPPTVRPLRLGVPRPAPLLTEGVAIACGGAALGPSPEFPFSPRHYQASIEVDGYELPPMPFGRIEIPVLPGGHTVRVFRRVDGRILSFTEVSVDVRPGSLVELLYDFYSNDMNQYDRKRPGGRKALLVEAGPDDSLLGVGVVLAVLGVVAVLFLLVIGTALLLR